jgi:hypothetical protein
MLPVVQLDNKGLFTFANLLSQVPPGAMTRANNINIDRPGIAETRRGFEFYGNVLSAKAIRGFIYDDTLLWYLINGSLVYDTGAGVWSTYSGSYFPPAGSFLNSTQSSGNFYFTTNNGVYKLDSLTNQPRQAGVPGALDIQGVISGVGNVVNNTSQVGYQAVFGYTDANDNLIMGAPSEFLFVSNNSGSVQNVSLSITVPNGLTTDYFVQVYRTANTGSLSVPPGNNFQLALVHQLTSGELTAGVVTLTDAVPDTLLGAFIYTADGQPTNFPNNAPPLCLDVCTYQGMTFYANYSTIQNADITMDSVGAPNGIQINDTISITDIAGPTTYTYTGKAANNFALREFKIDTGGTIAQNIDATARNLVAAINQDPGNTLFYARYLTGENILPGAIVIEAQNLQDGSFYLNSSRQTCWTPSIPAAGTNYQSANNARPNGMLISKVNQPEAVPAAYELLLQAGTTNIVIFRVIALQDAVYAFTSGGIFRITGSDPTTLQTLLFDSSSQIEGLATPQILNNSIFYMSTQGVCSVSSGGNQILSRNVERDILALAALPTFPSVAFGTSYESDRKYLLFTPSASSPSEAVQNYVYNWITQTWTLWTRPTTAAIVNTAVDRLFIADNVGNIFEERKSFTNADYSDQSYAVTIVSTTPSTNEIVLTDSSDVQINDILQQTVGLNQFSTQVTGNNLLTNTLTVLDASGFAAGPAIDYRSIATELQYAPIHCGFAEYVKKFSSWQFMFSNADFNEITLNMSSDFYPTEEQVMLTPVSFGGWGTLPWGTFPWGVSTVPEQVIPTWPTKNTGYAHWIILNLTLSQAFTALALDGISATYEVTSTRGR